MPLPVSFYSMTLADETLKRNGQPETTVWRIPIQTVTAANYDATQTELTTLRNAVLALILGNMIRNATESSVFQAPDPSPAASPLAQRENKWLVRFHDSTTGQKFQVSIGTADLTKKMANSEFIDLTAGDGLAFKNAFQAVVVSPNESGNAVVVDSIQFVGRNT